MCVYAHIHTLNPPGVLFSGGYESSASIKIIKCEDNCVSWSPIKSQGQGHFSREKRIYFEDDLQMSQ